MSIPEVDETNLLVGLHVNLLPYISEHDVPDTTYRIFLTLGFQLLALVTQQTIMSNVQQYLLTVYSDQEKALTIAQETARGILPYAVTRPIKADVSRPGVKAIDTDRGRPIFERVHQR